MPKNIPRMAVLGSLHPKVLQAEDRAFHEHEIREKGEAWEQSQKQHGRNIGYPREGHLEMLPAGSTKLISEDEQDLWGRPPYNPVTPPAGMSLDASQARVTGLVPRPLASPGVVPPPGLHPEVSEARARVLQ